MNQAEYDAKIKLEQDIKALKNNNLYLSGKLAEVTARANMYVSSGNKAVESLEKKVQILSNMLMQIRMLVTKLLSELGEEESKRILEDNAHLLDVSRLV